jgi:hypothetical protein
VLLAVIGRSLGVAGYGAYGPIWRDGRDLPRHEDLADMEDRLHLAQARCAVLEARLAQICRRPWRPVRDLVRYRLKTLVASVLAPLVPTRAAALRAAAARHDPARLRA